MLGFRRLSAASYRVVHRVIDDDGTFRARVAAAAPDEATVGRAGWLWLHRPVDWAQDPAFAGDGAPLAAAPEAPAPSSKDAVAKHRRAAKEAEAARRAAMEEAAALRKEVRRLEEATAELVGRLAAFEEERHAAVRAAKEHERSLASARGELKAARRAARQAEEELLLERTARDASSEAVEPPEASASSSGPAPEPSAVLPPSVDLGGVASEVRAAAAAASVLAESLARVAAAVEAPSERSPVVSAAPSPSAKGGGGTDGGGAKAAGGKGKRAKRRTRVDAVLPPGVFDATPEAHRHLIRDPANLLVVDGYNLARTAWDGVSIEEERRRTVALLDAVQARSGGEVVVVFDGDDAVVGPAASRSVRVRYSASGETADDAIRDLLAGVGVERPVVVVSSDRAVAADARRQGATTIGSRAFLVAAGR